MSASIDTTALRAALTEVERLSKLRDAAIGKLAEYEAADRELQPAYAAASDTHHHVLGRHELGEASADELAGAKKALAEVDAPLGELAARRAAVSDRLDAIEAELATATATTSEERQRIARLLAERGEAELRERWRSTIDAHRKHLLLLEVFGEARHSARAALGNHESANSIVALMRTGGLTEGFALSAERRPEPPLNVADLLRLAEG